MGHFSTVGRAADGECWFCNIDTAKFFLHVEKSRVSAHSVAHHGNGGDGGLISVVITETGLPDKYFL